MTALFGAIVGVAGLRGTVADRRAAPAGLGLLLVHHELHPQHRLRDRHHPAGLLALLDSGWEEMVLVILVYSVLNVTIQTFIQPRFVGNSVGLSAEMTYMSLVVWAFLLGAAGRAPRRADDTAGCGPSSSTRTRGRPGPHPLIDAQVGYPDADPKPDPHPDPALVGAPSRLDDGSPVAVALLAVSPGPLDGLVGAVAPRRRAGSGRTRTGDHRAGHRVATPVASSDLGGTRTSCGPRGQSVRCTSTPRTSTVITPPSRAARHRSTGRAERARAPRSRS